MAVIKLADTHLLDTMADAAGTPPLRARKFSKGIPFVRPAAAMTIQQPGGGAPIELEVAGAFRVPSVRGGFAPGWREPSALSQAPGGSGAPEGPGGRRPRDLARRQRPCLMFTLGPRSLPSPTLPPPPPRPNAQETPPRPPPPAGRGVWRRALPGSSLASCPSSTPAAPPPEKTPRYSPL